jgi:hypothetical protein
VEPIKIATQIKARDGMTKAYDIRPAHALHDLLPGRMQTSTNGEMSGISNLWEGEAPLAWCLGRHQGERGRLRPVPIVPPAR